MNCIWLDIFMVLLPAILGYIASAFCRIGTNTGSSVKFRPPPLLFGIIWPILYLSLGFSWIIAHRINPYSNIFYVLTIILLTLWIIIYGCVKSKMGGIYILLLTFVLLLMCFSFGNEWSRVLISPLIGWLMFAILLSITEIQNS